MKNDLPKLLEAISFAAQKHVKQKRKGADGQPYINHVLEVVNLLANVGKIEDYDVLIAAVLHDTVEDTETTVEDITKLFGAKVAKYVSEVTDDKTLPKDAQTASNRTRAAFIERSEIHQTQRQNQQYP